MFMKGFTNSRSEDRVKRVFEVQDEHDGLGMRFQICSELIHRSRSSIRRKAELNRFAVLQISA